MAHYISDCQTRRVIGLLVVLAMWIPVLTRQLIHVRLSIHLPSTLCVGGGHWAPALFLVAHVGVAMNRYQETNAERAVCKVDSGSLCE